MIPGTAKELDELMPRVLPVNWARARKTKDGDLWSEDQHVYMRDMPSHLSVITTIDVARDGSRWLHLSASQRSRVPTWAEMREVKDLFIGRNRKAISVMPPDDEYVNIHPYVLHLWSPLGTDPIPDLRNEDGML